MGNYRFYGWEQATVPAQSGDYPGIGTPQQLYDVLAGGIWQADTCAPRLRDGWSEDNRTLGQCSIPAFRVQDNLGCRVDGIPQPGGNYHCYNVGDGPGLDLTTHKFG